MNMLKELDVLYKFAKDNQQAKTGIVELESYYRGQISAYIKVYALLKGRPNQSLKHDSEAAS